MARCVHRDAASRNLMALWLAKDLVYPDQKISSRDLLSWNRAISKLCALPEEQLASFCQTFLHAVEDHAHPGVRHEIEKAIKEEPKARSCAALLGAVLMGAATVFVLSKCGSYAYEIVFD